MSANDVSGSCLCGTVRFAARSPAAASAHCHCHYCRFSSGAAFVTWVVIPDQGFQMMQGEERLKWYQSSAQSKRGFCTNCGSTMFFRSELCPGEIHITRANLTGTIEPRPQYNCFYDQGVDWVSVDTKGLKALSSDSPEIAHYKVIPPPDSM